MTIKVKVVPESNHEKAIMCLMSRCSFPLVDTVIIGTQSTDVLMLLTFKYEQLYFDRYKVSFYVQIDGHRPDNLFDIPVKDTFYSLECLYGKQCDDVVEFKDWLDKNRLNKPIEAKHFK